jgi:hypothetical protein
LIVDVKLFGHILLMLGKEHFYPCGFFWVVSCWWGGVLMVFDLVQIYKSITCKVKLRISIVLIYIDCKNHFSRRQRMPISHQRGRRMNEWRAYKQRPNNDIFCWMFMFINHTNQSFIMKQKNPEATFGDVTFCDHISAWNLLLNVLF